MSTSKEILDIYDELDHKEQSALRLIAIQRMRNATSRTWTFVAVRPDSPIILGVGSGTASAALTFFGYGPYVLVGLIVGIVMTGFYLAVSAVLQLAK